MTRIRYVYNYRPIPWRRRRVLMTNGELVAMAVLIVLSLISGGY